MLNQTPRFLALGGNPFRSFPYSLKSIPTHFSIYSHTFFNLFPILNPLATDKAS
jgi:hypothetical protein